MVFHAAGRVLPKFYTAFLSPPLPRFPRETCDATCFRFYPSANSSAGTADRLHVDVTPDRVLAEFHCQKSPLADLA